MPLKAMTVAALAVLLGACAQVQEIEPAGEIARAADVQPLPAEPAAQTRPIALQLPSQAETPRITVLRGTECELGSQRAAKSPLLALSPLDYANVFQDELRRVGYLALDAEAAGTRGSQAEFLIVARMSNARANVCLPVADLGDIYDGKGEAGLTVRWQVYATRGNRLVYTTTQQGYAKVDEVIPAAGRELLRAAFARAIHGLLADEGFRAILRTPPAG